MKTRFILNALHSVRYSSCRRRGWENTRNKNILVVKISVHVSLGMRGTDTREGRELFLLGSRAWHVRLISYRWADCVDEMIKFTVRYHSNPCAHILTVSLSLTSRSQSTAISQFLSWKDDNLILLRDGSSDNLWRWGCVEDWTRHFLCQCTCHSSGIGSLIQWLWWYGLWGLISDSGDTNSLPGSDCGQVRLEQVSVKGTYISLIWCHSGSKGYRASSVKMPSTSAVLPSAPLLSQSTQVVKNQIV